MNETSEDISAITLPGYSLVRRLGSGGYGEVWLAHAPGGLDKAIKIIFGFHNEKRAERELRSLEKIKEVRHPFLLSLERIEVIEGRLVIVTELADASLKDRYDACIQAGQPGIPRHELLGYLRDTADALDFLNHNHSLQHLDIKPENLLLVAGHVKVADFGLVKRIQDTQASLVGGLTPLYAAPEVFQGAPSGSSDQYSLAVLYQEMLTGKLPFDGANSAELTLQHMHDEPNLAPLELADRYVLARALSKDPESRFETCSAMVQALIQADHNSDAPSPVSFTPPAQNVVVTPSPNSCSVRHPGSMTQVFEDELCEESDVSESMLLDTPTPEEPSISKLPPMDIASADWKPTPVLFLGIGGTAGCVLRQLKRRICNQFGESTLPAMQMLLLDTDSKAIVDATHGEMAGLSNEETVTLPLRRPQDYRGRSQHMLKWLSRRWLYNIPKSLRTEGLRPLGRLAFVDHARRTVQRIRLSLSQATDTQALEESSAATGREFQSDAVRVYIVASISGGTGSGMTLDVAYAVRTVLQKLGIESATTKGIMLHSTGRSSRLSDLAKVNAFSWLTEFNHFHRPGGYYPGDDASGLPVGEPGQGAFDDTYLVHLGDGLTMHDLEEQASKVADYLYLDGFTAAQAFFARNGEEKSPACESHYPLRTFALEKFTNTPRQTLEGYADDVARQVFNAWTGEKQCRNHVGSSAHEQLDDSETLPLSKTDQIVCGAAQAVAQLQLNLQGIAGKSFGIIEKQFGSNAETLLTRLLGKMPDSGKPATMWEMVQLIDGLFSGLPETPSESNSDAFVMGRQLDSIISPLCMKLAGDLQRWVMQRLDDRQERLLGTQEAVDWLAKHLDRVDKEASRMKAGLQAELNKKAQLLCSAEAGERSLETGASQDVADQALKYFRMRLELCTLQAAGMVARTMQSEIEGLREIIIEFGRHIRNLASSIASDAKAEAKSTPAKANTSEDHAAEELDAFMEGRFPDIAKMVDRQLQEDFIDEHNGLFETIMGSGATLRELLEKTKAIAFQRVESVAQEFNSRNGDASKPEDLDGANVLRESPLLKYGGVTRNLLVLPQEQISPKQAKETREEWSPEISLLADKTSEMTLCCEAGEIPLRSVAVDLIELRRDYVEFADRVHTRKDVTWTSLSNPVIAERSEQAPFMATQVLS